MPRNLVLRSKLRSALYLRSIARAPIARRLRLIGTQMKLSSWCDSSGRRAARCRNAGSRLTCGTTIGLPLWTTLPVIPSPTR